LIHLFQPNGANLTGGGNGSSFEGSTYNTPSYIPFNGVSPPLSLGIWNVLAIGLIGAILGIFNTIY